MDRHDPLGTSPFYFEEFFREGLHLACPRCRAHVVARFGSEAAHMPYWERRMTLVCDRCGFRRAGETAYRNWLDGVGHRYREMSPWSGIARRPTAVGPMTGAAIGEVRAEFWARTRCNGRELLAANPWHLKALRAYVAPLVRAHCPYTRAAHQDWRERLPSWMKDTEARAAVLASVDRLAQRFADRP